MARSKSRDTIVTEIAALQAKLKAHDKAEAERLGHLAIKSGIGAIDISDEELSREFQAIVSRFREGPPPVEEPKAKGHRSSGQAPQRADDQAA